MLTSFRTLAFSVAVGSFIALGSAGAYAQAANPCAPKAANPCAAKKAADDKAMMDKKPANPCAPKPANPCAAKKM
jgi:hypothetical protein